MWALPYLAIISSLIAAGLGVRAATISVRNSMDDFTSTKSEGVVVFG